MAMAGLLGVLLATASAAADARTDYLVRLLKNSSTFRVRAQAALSLGKSDEDGAKVVRALTQALKDDHSAVRTAAAASLRRVGNPSALGALRSARNDEDAAVRRAVRKAIRKLKRLKRRQPKQDRGRSERQDRAASAQYYVGVGKPGSRVDGIDDSTLRSTREYIEQRVRDMSGVVVAPQGEGRSQVQRKLQQKDLTGYYVDSSIVKIQDKDSGTRAVVSVILNTYPGRDMRAMLQGAATVPNRHGARARKQAIEGAIRGALRRLPQAMESADARARR
jgi:hypothetical protein